MSAKPVNKTGAFVNRKRSLESKAVRSIFVSCIIIGVSTLLIGLAIYTLSLVRQYIDNAFSVSVYASQSVNTETEAVSLAEAVMAIYDDLSDEPRQTIGTDSYRSLFEHLESDHTYNELLQLLSQYYRSDSISDIYLAMYDERTNALVYIADPDDRNRLSIGDWEPVSETETRKFLNWDGQGKLYDVSYTEKYGWLCTAGVPITDSEGKVCCFVLADVSTEEVWAGMRTYVLQITLAMTLIVLVLILVLYKKLMSNIVNPINLIAQRAGLYARDKLAGVEESSHFADLHINTGDEIENLANTMSDMERDMVTYERNLAKVSADKERIETELLWANRIQSAMLPSSFPAFPDRKDFDLYASMTPAKEVGGDFYDFFLVDDDHLCMVIADVSGKGVPAALFMMAAKIIIASNSMLGYSPSKILSLTNNAICSNNKEEMFVSVWLGILELSTGKLTAANAGHEYPAILDDKGVFRVFRDRHGLVIGAMENTPYKDYELTLKPGQKIFVYTDGVPEATNASDELFGEERMTDALNQNPDASAREILDNVTKAIGEFTEGVEPFDDLTMLCIDYKGNK